MRRIHLFEIEDQSWCPQALRGGITEFLATVTRLSKLWKPTSAVLGELARGSSEKQIIVLGSGSGGGILDVAPDLPSDMKIILTDLYPHQKFQSRDPRISYLPDPVDATRVPKHLKGTRVMYASFHHLSPELAKKVLKNAVDDGQPIAIFEGTERSIKGTLGLIFVPVMVLLITPLIRPFRWSRLFLTYAVPILPFAIFWDGLVSALRTYDVEEMKELVAELTGYDWKIGILAGPHGENIPMLAGKPKVERSGI